jgi:hypothetical protein
MAARSLFALALASLPLAALGDSHDYLGTLKAPQSSLTPPGVYSFTTATSMASNAALGDDGYRLKLGYKYSRFVAVEGEYVDFKREGAPFANPASLASSFRSTGFGVDTIAMLPLWRFSFYGRMGAYRGDARAGYSWHPMPLSENQFTRNTRLRMGLGLRYDFTRSLGVRAEVERHSALRDPLASEFESGDQVSVGVSWRF